MATRCFNPVLGKRIRVTRLDTCGNLPASGALEDVVVSSGFITVTLSTEVEEGTEILQKRADGSLCVNERSSDSFKRFTIEMEFCGVDPALLSVVTNAEIYEDWAGDVAGFTVGEGAIDGAFSFELWTGLSGQACASGAEEASGYLLNPFVNSGVLGDIAVDGENAVTFSLTGAFTRGGNQWATGPFEVLLNGVDPDVLPVALDPLDHLLMIETGVAPPPAACGFSPYLPAA